MQLGEFDWESRTWDATSAKNLEALLSKKFMSVANSLLCTTTIPLKKMDDSTLFRDKAHSSCWGHFRHQFLRSIWFAQLRGLAASQPRQFWLSFCRLAVPTAAKAVSGCTESVVQPRGRWPGTVEALPNRQWWTTTWTATASMLASATRRILNFHL